MKFPEDTVNKIAGAVTPYAGVWIEIIFIKSVIIVFFVTPYAGVWIEIAHFAVDNVPINVTPYAGVWIEIFPSNTDIALYLSLPTRECGLKWH